MHLTRLQSLEARLPESWPLLAAALAFVAGIAIALGAARWSAALAGRVDPEALDAVAAAVERIEERMDLQAQTGERLSEEIARLHARIESLESRESLESPVDATSPEPDLSTLPPVSSGTPVRIPNREAEEDPSALDEQALLAAGLAPERVEQLRDRWSELLAARRELDARADAGGWAHSYRHLRAQRELETGLRQELDELDYDGLLYATGRPNRLVVSEVAADSPAARAGVKAGDRILRYDGERVLSGAELHAAASAGEAEEAVQLEIERGGDRWSVVVPRQPLGVHARTTRDRPARP